MRNGNVIEGLTRHFPMIETIILTEGTLSESFVFLGKRYTRIDTARYLLMFDSCEPLKILDD